MGQSEAESGQQALVRRYRSISDPVRLDIFEALRVDNEPLTTAEIVRRVPAARRGVQSHLREMQNGKWIEHLDGEGREARWAHCPPRVEYAEDSGDAAEVDQAVQELFWVASQRRVARLRTWDNERLEKAWPPEWVAASIGRDWSVRATPDDLQELDAEITKVINDFRDRITDRRSQPDAGSRAVFVIVDAFPLRPHK